MMKKIFSLFLCILLTNQLNAQTIAEKKAGLTNGGTDLSTDLFLFLTQVNRELSEAQTTLKILYAQVAQLHQQNAPEDSYRHLLSKINEVKQTIEELQRGWREMAVEASHEEAYALWHQPETTLGQLVMDYSSFSYVYLIPPEIADIRLNVDSNLPIPRASWEEMLELILKQNGIGIAQLNPYLRQLYFVSENNSNVTLITKNRKELDLYPSNARVTFVLSPDPSEVRRTWLFLEKFANPNTTILHSIGRDILIIAQVSDILDLLKLYDFVAQNRGDNEYRVIPLRKVDASEMAHIISTILDQNSIESNSSRPKRLKPGMNGEKKRFRQEGDAPPRDYKEIDTANGLKIIPVINIANALLLVGTKAEIRKAEDIIREIEGQVGEAREKVIYWYNTKHSDAEELADVLYRIYALMAETNPNGPVGDGTAIPVNNTPALTPTFPEQGPAQPFPQRSIYDEGFYLTDQYVVNPNPSADFGYPERILNQRSNFIVDMKTGAIVMVVEADILPKIKELIHKLDIPKKMVQLEVLLFEKRVNKEDTFGMNLLRLGDAALNKNRGGFSFNDLLPIKAKEIVPANSGVTQFFLSRKQTCSGIPAFDILYKFLLSRQDVQINASPSIITVNQTPAKIAIEEEISVSTGIFQVPTSVGPSQVALKDAFARARYGIKIEITPTIHMRENDEEAYWDDSPNYVSLESDIAFETIQAGGDPTRPDVTRRVINNTAIVPDGQTIILGGLRKKQTHDAKEAIPYFGELPGIGKLFSFTELEEDTTEMFIFITPKIISDPEEELKCLRSAEMSRRPGDIPEFLCQLVAAREMEKERLMEGTMTILFGREPDRCVAAPEGEYDGR
jgi:general secretion pathway protein D